jgi:hypothetical protein
MALGNWVEIWHWGFFHVFKNMQPNAKLPPEEFMPKVVGVQGYRRGKIKDAGRQTEDGR